MVVSELVACNEDDPDAVDEGPDPECFDDVFELANKNMSEPNSGNKPQFRKSVSGTHKEIIHVQVDRMSDL